jgi:hypothetical protein
MPRGIMGRSVAKRGYWLPARAIGNCLSRAQVDESNAECGVALARESDAIHIYSGTCASRDGSHTALRWFEVERATSAQLRLRPVSRERLNRQSVRGRPAPRVHFGNGAGLRGTLWAFARTCKRTDNHRFPPRKSCDERGRRLSIENGGPGALLNAKRRRTLADRSG